MFALATLIETPVSKVRIQGTKDSNGAGVVGASGVHAMRSKGQADLFSSFWAPLEVYEGKSL